MHSWFYWKKKKKKKKKLLREKSLYLACNEEYALFFTSEAHEHYAFYSFQKVCEAL